MIKLQYRVWPDGNLWHREVLTERGVRLRHGATDSTAKARAEAMSSGIDPATHVEIDTTELSRSAELLERAYRAFADAEVSFAGLEGRLLNLLEMRVRSTNLAKQSREALALSWRLLREIDESRRSNGQLRRDVSASCLQNTTSGR
jgi:hypothetical protein